MTARLVQFPAAEGVCFKRRPRDVRQAAARGRVGEARAVSIPAHGGDAARVSSTMLK